MGDIVSLCQVGNCTLLGKQGCFLEELTWNQEEMSGFSKLVILFQ